MKDEFFIIPMIVCISSFSLMDDDEVDPVVDPDEVGDEIDADETALIWLNVDDEDELIM